jgi:hypothetical protein
MIKIFRKFRQQLLSENKFSKYFLYALGEILLVVIGILFALQINNWNEYSKNRQIGIVFLEDFKNDLTTDIETLDQMLYSNDLRIANADTILFTLAESKTLSKAERLKFYDQNYSLTSESYFIPERSTINQFESSSNGHLISSKELKDKLFRYYSTNERVENNLEKSVQLYQHSFITKGIITSMLLGDFLEDLIGSDLGRPELDLNVLKKNDDYLFSILAKKTGTEVQNLVYEQTIDSAKELITLIDEEIGTEN